MLLVPAFGLAFKKFLQLSMCKQNIICWQKNYFCSKQPSLFQSLMIKKSGRNLLEESDASTRLVWYSQNVLRISYGHYLAKGALSQELLGLKVYIF
jgi:hypothetical protein